MQRENDGTLRNRGLIKLGNIFYVPSGKHEKRNMKVKVILPSLESTVSEALILKALSRATKRELIGIVWRRKSLGYSDGYFALVYPDGNDHRNRKVFYLGPRKNNMPTMFSIRLNTNKASFMVDGRAKVQNIELANYPKKAVSPQVERSRNIWPENHPLPLSCT